MISSCGFDIIRPCRLILMFQRNILPPSSRLKDFNYIWNGYFIFKLGQVRRNKQPFSIFFLSFRRVVNVIYSFLGNSPASEI